MAEAIWLAQAIAREALLFAAIGFLIGGIDDLFVDILWLGRIIRRRVTVYRRNARATLADFAAPAGRYAVFVPAWDEGDVVAAMLRLALSRLDHAALVVFVGCYPNDRETIDAVASVAVTDERIRLVVNPRPGPTTKADNLNAQWAAMRTDEEASGTLFDAVVIVTGQSTGKSMSAGFGGIGGAIVGLGFAEMRVSERLQGECRGADRRL